MPVLQSCASSQPQPTRLAAPSLGPDWPALELPEKGDCRASREEAGQGFHWPFSPITCKAKTFAGGHDAPRLIYH